MPDVNPKQTLYKGSAAASLRQLYSPTLAGEPDVAVVKVAAMHNASYTCGVMLLAPKQ
jgi:hypothetical protein